MDAVQELLHKALAEAAQLSNRSTGELCLEIGGRLPAGTQIRITAKGVRVTHSEYHDRLVSAEKIDASLKNRLTV